MPFVRHTVAMNLSLVSPENIEKMSALVKALSENPAFGIVHNSGIVGLHNNADMKQGLNRGCTHFFEMLFMTAAHRDYYAPHQQHQNTFVNMIELGFSLNDKDFNALDCDAVFSQEIIQAFLQGFEQKHNMTVAQSIAKIECEELKDQALEQASTLLSSNHKKE